MKYQFEFTDTYGGEANYSWVKRTTVEVPDGTTDKVLSTLAREWAGLTGLPCKVEKYADTIAIRPRGMAQVLFVSWVEAEPKEISVADVELWAIGVRQAMASEYRHLVHGHERDVSAAVLGGEYTLDAAISYLAHIGVQGEPARAGVAKLRELDAALPDGTWSVCVGNDDDFSESLGTEEHIAYGEETLQIRALGGMVLLAWVAAK